MNRIRKFVFTAMLALLTARPGAAEPIHSGDNTTPLSTPTVALKGVLANGNNLDAPYIDPDFEQILVFVVMNESLKRKQLSLVPVNHDLLQSFADNHGYTIQIYPELILQEPLVKTLVDIKRFNDPLKVKTLKQYKLQQEFSDKELKIPPPPDPFFVWQSNDGKRIAAKLKALTSKSVFWVLPWEQVTRAMLIAGTRRAHFNKVPTKSNPEEANPGNEVPNLIDFLTSDKNTTSH